MKVEDTERGRMDRTGLIAGAVFFVILLFAPGIPLDGPQRKVAAVTALTATWWITVALPVGATALMPAILFPLLGVMSAKEVAPVYMRDLVMLFLGAFIIALGLERWGVHRRMALFIISKVGGSPRRLVLGFMAASAFLSLWINNTATTLLMLPIALAVLGRVEGGEVHAPLRAPDPEDNVFPIWEEFRAPKTRLPPRCVRGQQLLRLTTGSGH